jgi:hypothetical protein
MNILTDILSLIKRKKFVDQAKANDVLVLGINEEPEIEGIASPVPYKDVKLIKVSDFISAGSVDAENVPIGGSEAGCFKDKVTDPVTGEATLNFRRLKSLSLDLTIQENGDYIEFDIDVIDEGIWSIPNAAGKDIYYDTFQDALDNASSGDTVYLHTNVLEASPVTVGLKDGVNVNFNGFTYTLDDASNINAIVDPVLGASCVLSNGIVRRRGATVAGGETNTLALYIQSSDSEITCENMIFTNNNGVACRVDGETRGIKGKGTVMGISCGPASLLYDSIGLGEGEGIGINATAVGKLGAIYNCIGYSDLGIGINVSICEIVNCKGYSGGSNGIKGSIVNIFSSLGYSEQGNGIYLLSSNADSCTGISLSVVEDLPIVSCGIKIENGNITKNCSGYGRGNSRGMGVITTGLISSSIISNSSADSNITALELYQDLSDAGVITDVVFMNSSFTAFRDVATINRQVADAEAKVNFMNCSFYTTSDLYSCIKSGAPVDVSYANCTFKTEQNFTGTPLVNINQAVTNTADNQGNTYI